jgi:hypothetical protein
VVNQGTDIALLLHVFSTAVPGSEIHAQMLLLQAPLVQSSAGKLVAAGRSVCTGGCSCVIERRMQVSQVPAQRWLMGLHGMLPLGYLLFRAEHDSLEPS